MFNCLEKKILINLYKKLMKEFQSFLLQFPEVLESDKIKTNLV